MPYRREPQPYRRLPDGVLVASASGEIMHLEATAGAIWDALISPAEIDTLENQLASIWPSVGADELKGTVEVVLASLIDAGVVRDN